MHGALPSLVDRRTDDIGLAPVRLVQDGDTWTLELHGLTPRAPNIYRTVVRRVVGKDGIALRITDGDFAPGLRRATERILLAASEPAQPARVFVREGEEWLLQPGEPERLAGGRGADDGVAAEHVRQLARRVDELETVVDALSRLLAEQASSPPVVAAAVEHPPVAAVLDEGSESPPDGDGDEYSAVAALLDGDGDAVEAESAEVLGEAHGYAAEARPGGSSDEAVDRQPSQEPDASAPPEWPAVSLPVDGTVMELVDGLTDGGSTVSRAQGDAWVLATGDEQHYVACLLDGDGESRGAVVFDLEATVRLSGAMLMEDTEIIEAQLAEGLASDDSVDAGGEIANTLAAAFNRLAGNEHVRATKLEPLCREHHRWLPHARQCASYVSSTGGKIALLAR